MGRDDLLDDATPPSSRKRPLSARHGRLAPEAAGEDPLAASPEADSLGGTSVAPDLDIPSDWRRDDDDDEQSESGPRSAAALPAPVRRIKPAAPLPDDSRPPAGLPRRRSPAAAVATAAAWALGAVLLSFLALRPAPFAQPVAIPLAVSATVVPAAGSGGALTVIVTIGPEAAEP